jgi:hypothetical protein
MTISGINVSLRLPLLKIELLAFFNEPLKVSCV